MSKLIRKAERRDAEAILEIYAPFVEKTAVSFERVVPTVQAAAENLEERQKMFPFLVYEEDGRVQGYANASSHRSRHAYQWSCETSIYLAEGQRGKGSAQRLYQELFSCLEKLGYFTAFAGATLPNPASIRFHQKMGFEPVGVYKNVGFKFGKWHDVSWFSKPIQEYIEPLDGPKRFSDEFFTSVLWSESA